MRNLENELKVRESMGSITDIAKSVSLRLAPDEDQHAEAREEDGPSDSEPPTSTRTTSDAPAPSSPEKSSSVGQNRIEQLKQEVWGTLGQYRVKFEGSAVCGEICPPNNGFMLCDKWLFTGGE